MKNKIKVAQEKINSELKDFRLMRDLEKLADQITSYEYARKQNNDLYKELNF